MAVTPGITSLSASTPPTIKRSTGLRGPCFIPTYYLAALRNPIFGGQAGLSKLRGEQTLVMAGDTRPSDDRGHASETSGLTARLYLSRLARDARVAAKLNALKATSSDRLPPNGRPDERSAKYTSLLRIMATTYHVSISFRLRDKLNAKPRLSYKSSDKAWEYLPHEYRQRPRLVAPARSCN